MSADDKLIVDYLLSRQKNRTWVGTWPAVCDICSNINLEITDLSKEEYFVDGKTEMGPWALMCPRCFEFYGVGLGTGRGQKYNSKTLEKVEG